LFEQAWLAFVLCDGTVVLAKLERLPKRAPYPKPFKQTLCVRLAFLTLPNSRKRAFFVVSH